MVQKLKSALKNPPLRLALKAALFGSALFWVRAGGFASDPSVGGAGPLLFFALFSFLLYFRRIQRPAFFGSFLVLLCAAVTTLFFLKSAWLVAAGIAFFVLIFVLLLGTKDLVFANRPAIFYAAVNLLFLAVFSLFFLAEKTSYFFVEYFAVFTASFLLLKDTLNFMAPYFPRRHLLIAAVAALAVAELAWAAALLPLGFINSAALLLMTVFIIGDFSLRHLNGALKSAAVFRAAAVFAVFLAIIFFSSRWGP
ncbi:MAG: hypothetical protein AAB560_02460 [Patescibacteria group bacterium]